MGKTRLLLAAIFLKSNHYLISAIVKIQRNEEALLTLEEKEVVKRFLATSNDDDDDDLVVVEPMNIDARLKRKRSLHSSKESQYINLDWMPATSDIVERFFSKVKLVLTDMRKSLLPVTLESILFLKVHMGIWSTTKFVQEAMRSEPENDDSDAEQEEDVWGHY